MSRLYRLSVWDDDERDWFVIAGGRTLTQLKPLVRGLRVVEPRERVRAEAEDADGTTADERQWLAAEHAAGELWP